MANKPKDLTPRFGIGEWFGKVLTRTDASERRYYASEVLKDKKLREEQPCPFKSSKQDAKCTKEGGYARCVCTPTKPRA